MVGIEQAIGKEVHYAMRKYNVPGLVIGIFKDGKAFFAQGYGTANLAFNIPINVEMRFRIGSISKSFTAAAILRLVEEGKLRLNEKICEFFENPPNSWKNITIEDLLVQKSGIADYLDKKFSKQGGLFDLRCEFRDDELIKNAYKLPVKPRKQFSYSNTNYMLLGMIIKNITGKFYYKYIKQKILNPLGMNSVTIHTNEEILRNVPNGYEIYKGKIVNARFTSNTFNNTADGSLYSNIYDIAKWSSLNYLNMILDESTLDKMFSINAHIGQNYGYGFGWFIRKESSIRIAEHTGSWGGFTVVIKTNLNKNIAVAVFTNIERENSEWLLKEASKILELSEKL